MNADASPFEALAAAIITAVTSGEVERPIDPDSQLASEIAASTDDVARHFLGELPRHCMMLVSAVWDACAGVSALDGQLPFSGVVLVRGLFEAVADLHWLSDPSVDRVERTRRTCLVFLRQTETTVRNLEAVRERGTGRGELTAEGLDEAIRQGWEYLKVTAQSMAAAGYKLETSRKPGSRYYLDAPKPAIGELVDAVITAFYGTTTLNVYSLYSSVAHVEGEGLGTLLDRKDTVETSAGTRYRYGFTEDEWRGRVVAPGVVVTARAVREWLVLAHPRRVDEFDGATRPLLRGVAST